MKRTRPGRATSPPVEITLRARPSAALSSLAAQAELLAIRLVRCEMEFHPDKIPEDGNIVLSTEHAQYKAESPTASGSLDCGIRLTLRMTPRASRDALLAQVFAEYSLAYRVPGSVVCDGEMVRRFAKTSGVHHAWPFFRELVHSMVSRTGLPPLVVPLFRMPLTHREGSF